MAAPGLTYQQAPPFSVPLRFFLTAPIFLFLAGVALLLPGAAAWQRWSPVALAVVHLVALGFLTMVMVGALLQLLAVAAGAPVLGARLLAAGVHGLLTPATLLLAAGLGLPQPGLLYPALALVALSLVMFLAAVAASLRRALRSATVWAMAVAAFALLLTLALGLALGGSRLGLWPLANFAVWVDVHAGWGLLGWVFVLLAGVAYVVVPMFQLTPGYPHRVQTFLVPAVLAGLLCLSLAWGLGIGPLAKPAELLLAACLAIFAGVTLHLQRQRRRRLPDVTLDYWRLAMASLVLAALLGALGALLPALAAASAYALLLGVVFLFGFAVPVASGMLYKIVPFLAWFHLQSQPWAKAGRLPTMKDFISEGRGRRQYHAYLAALAMLLASVFFPVPWLAAGGAALCLAAFLLGFNLWHAWRLFAGHGGRLA